jgi:hypothetical protein
VIDSLPDCSLDAKERDTLDRMVALAEQCMGDYDENGWTDPSWINPDDVQHTVAKRPARAAE